MPPIPVLALLSAIALFVYGVVGAFTVGQLSRIYYSNYTGEDASDVVIAVLWPLAALWLIVRFAFRYPVRAWVAVFRWARTS